MQTALADFIRHTPQGEEAERILRACVHCGFCNATCPTYQLLGDELDGPRGRIYLMKQVLEGSAPTNRTLLHLDRCLTCRNCETTCPSGVRYGALVDIGRDVIEHKIRRPWHQRLVRRGLRLVIPYRRRFKILLRLGQFAAPVLPGFLRRSVPPRRRAGAWPVVRHARRMLVLDGCAQPAIAPQINTAAARVLDQLGVSLIRAEREGCCGAVSFHLTAQDEGKDFMRRNIDAWWPHIEAGAEAIVMTASGCGVMVRDYGGVLRDDRVYADKAARVSALTKDLSEVLAQEDLARLKDSVDASAKIAFQSPCTLQHGQKVNGVVEGILRRLGFTLTPVPDAHLCCGSAGTYSILQHDLSRQLLRRKLDTLESGHPDIIATANIGCLAHLQTGTTLPVRHWIELLTSDRQVDGSPNHSAR